MNGRYEGWRTDQFCFIGPYDRNRRCFWSPIPADRRVWAAMVYGFSSAVDTWQHKPAQIIDVVFQQILEAINERRYAVKTYVPHDTISDNDWNAMWRYITWQDLFRYCGVGALGYLSLQSLIAVLRGMIWNDYWQPYNTEFYKLNPWLLPLARFFCYPTDDDPDGTNFSPFGSLADVLEYADVGGHDGDGNTTWTLHPGRHGRSAEYSSGILQLPRPSPLPFYCEYTWELKQALNAFEYLYPALGFNLSRLYDARTDYSACAETWALADYQAHLATVWDATSPVVTPQTKNDWPSAEYYAYVSPAGFQGCPDIETRFYADTKITRWYDPLIPEYEFLLDGYYAYDQSPPSGWQSIVGWTQESGASLAANLTGMLPDWSAEWSWQAVNARKYIEFDYRSDNT